MWLVSIRKLNRVLFRVKSEHFGRSRSESTKINSKRTNSHLRITNFCSNVWTEPVVNFDLWIEMSYSAIQATFQEDSSEISINRCQKSQKLHRSNQNTSGRRNLEFLLLNGFSQAWVWPCRGMVKHHATACSRMAWLAWSTPCRYIKVW